MHVCACVCVCACVDVNNCACIQVCTRVYMWACANAQLRRCCVCKCAAAMTAQTHCNYDSVQPYTTSMRHCGHDPVLPLLWRYVLNCSLSAAAQAGGHACAHAHLHTVPGAHAMPPALSHMRVRGRAFGQDICIYAPGLGKAWLGLAQDMSAEGGQPGDLTHQLLLLASLVSLSLASWRRARPLALCSAWRGEGESMCVCVCLWMRSHAQG